MFQTLPDSVDALDVLSWSSYTPFVEALQNHPLSEENIEDWLQQWSQLTRLINEAYTQKEIAYSADTRDAAAEAAYNTMVEEVVPEWTRANQALRMKFLETGHETDEIRLFVRDLRNEVELFREENVALQTELTKLGTRYDKLTGGLMVDWGGEEKNLSQMVPFLQTADRKVREKAWRVMLSAWESIRGDLDTLFLEMLAIRKRIAANAGFSDFRAYQFRALGRFDYTPADCETFHDAIESVVVPLAAQILAKSRRLQGISETRPWDWFPEQSIANLTAGDDEPLAPYQTEEELIQAGIDMFHNLDPVLGSYFSDMAEFGQLDLQSRPGKAMGGYCATLHLQNRAFIFMNGVGTNDTVQTLLHEAGHAFHAYESQKPLIWQEHAPMEFCEVAAMSMEKLAAPYLLKEKGGFYSKRDAAHAFIDHLQNTILFLPYMATVDAFQHWLYTTETEITAADLDQKWLELEQRFLSEIDYGDALEYQKSGWHRKLHIFQVPFYYIEYGMAQIGALQIWRNSLEHGEAAALAGYRNALQKGGTLTLPELFAEAKIEFRFDRELLTQLGQLIESQVIALSADTI